MSEPAFAIIARGRTDDHRRFVTDGCLILREEALADLAGAYTVAAEVRELTADQIGRALATAAQSFTLLDALVPSRVYPDLFRTGDDVALGARYVALLRRLPGPIQCGTSGPRSQVMLYDPRGLLGALMPVSALPELGVHLASPSPGAVRGRLLELAPDGGGRLSSADGLVAFAAIALHGATPRDLAVGALVDCDVDRGVATALWPAGTPRPASVVPPPPVSWPRSWALRSLQANGLCGEFDGGSFARLLQSLAPAPDLAALLRDDPIDEALVFDTLAAHYGPIPAGAAACRDGIFLLPRAAPAEPAVIAAATQRFAAHHGLTLAPDATAADLGAAADLLADALRAADRPERVWLVGRRAPFLLLRGEIQESGPTLGATAWTPRTPARPASFVEAFAQRLQVGGVTGIQSVARLVFDATPSTPAHTVHVLQRTLTGDRLEPYVWIVTDGLSQRPLAATSPTALHRFELVTLSRRHDRELRDSLSWLGESIHLLTARADAPPIALGHCITVGTPGGHRGWSGFLLARATGPVEGPWGTVDVARVVPLRDEERAELQASPDVLDGWRFVIALENADFDEVLDRWYARLPPAPLPN